MCINFEQNRLMWYSLGTSNPITSKTHYFEKRYFETPKFEISELRKTYYIKYPFRRNPLTSNSRWFESLLLRIHITVFEVMRFRSNGIRSPEAKPLMYHRLMASESGAVFFNHPVSNQSVFG